MKTKFLFLLLFPLYVLAVPNVITYQGQLYTNNSPLTATQEFSFAMITNSTVVWQSGSTVTTLVENGMFSVNLGDPTIMNAIPSGVFSTENDVYLRVSVGNLGSTLTVLSPDKKITSAGYSFDAGTLARLSPKDYMRKFQNVYVLGYGGRDGGADTNSLAAALNVAGAMASSANPCTILVLPGIYAGFVSSVSNVNIVGLSRDACVITGTFTVVEGTMLQNLTFRNLDTVNGINVQTNSVYIDNVKIQNGFYGIDVSADAQNVTVHNVDVTGKTNAAIRDASGIVIDGLRVDGRAAFELTTIDKIRYNNIICKNEPYYSGKTLSAVNGIISDFSATKLLDIQKCGDLDINNIDIDCSSGTALAIGTVYDSLKIYDGYINAPDSDTVTINNNTNDAFRKITFNDVRIEAQGDFNVIKIETAPYVSIKDSELVTDTAGLGVDIFSSTGSFVFVQTSWLKAGYNNIVLMAPNTELFVYDSTLLNSTGAGTASIQGYISGSTTGYPPRIADCRFEIDTNPSQNVGAPGWNAFKANGAVGFQEDANGNIVAPGSGTPVSP